VGPKNLGNPNIEYFAIFPAISSKVGPTITDENKSRITEFTLILPVAEVVILSFIVVKF
jgi:hypothetical protein